MAADPFELFEQMPRPELFVGRRPLGWERQPWLGRWQLWVFLASAVVGLMTTVLLLFRKGSHAGAPVALSDSTVPPHRSRDPRTAPAPWDKELAEAPASLTTSCACRAQCRAAGCVELPEVQVVYLPHVPADAQRLARLRSEYDAHTPCGRCALRPAPGVDPHLWVTGGGRYAEVKRFGMQVPEVPLGPAMASSPWYVRHNIKYAQVDERNRSASVLQGFPYDHHCGCTLSHFVVWMRARERGLTSLIISESDGFLEYWWTTFARGPPDDYFPVVLALLEDAPPDWDVIFLDKGTSGAGPNPRAVKRIERSCFRSSYDVFSWFGDGMAGAALYMVSGRFLAKVPDLIRDHGLDMVDAWIGSLCSMTSRSLRCYSVAATNGLVAGAPLPPSPACGHACVYRNVSSTCLDRIRYLMDARNGGRSCTDARSIVHAQCSVCGMCAFGVGPCAEGLRPPFSPQPCGRPSDEDDRPIETPDVKGILFSQ